MTTGRTILAAVIGGAVMFCWGAISHMALPIGEMGIQNLPGEETLLPGIKHAIRERGFYFFPGMDESDTSEAAQKAWEEKYRAGPRGVLIFDPTGGQAMSTAMLATEFLSNVAAALLAAAVLARINGTRFTRVLLGTLIGVIAWLSIDVSYWNWYRFPDAFLAAQLIDQTAGWLLTAATIALVLGQRPAPVGV